MSSPLDNCLPVVARWGDRSSSCRWIDEIYERNPDAIRLTGLDGAIVGIGERVGMSPVLLYDRDRLVSHFIETGLDAENAEEWVSVNIEGAWCGEGTPIVCTIERG